MSVLDRLDAVGKEAVVEAVDLAVRIGLTEVDIYHVLYSLSYAEDRLTRSFLARLRFRRKRAKRMASRCAKVEQPNDVRPDDVRRVAFRYSEGFVKASSTACRLMDELRLYTVPAVVLLAGCIFEGQDRIEKVFGVPPELVKVFARDMIEVVRGQPRTWVIDHTAEAVTRATLRGASAQVTIAAEGKDEHLEVFLQGMEAFVVVFRDGIPAAQVRLQSSLGVFQLEDEYEV